MGKASDLSVLEKSKIITMRQDGSSFLAISKSVGRSETAVKNVLDNFEKEGKISPDRKNDCDRELAIFKKGIHQLITRRSSNG